MTLGVCAFGILMGAPIVGALISLETAEYVRAQVFGGVVLAATSAIVCIVRCLQVRFMIV